MDELFRKAAAGYPLKTDNNDWDGLASRLLIPTTFPTSGQKKNKFNKYGLPLLLVFFMLVLGGGPVKRMRHHSADYPPSSATSEVNSRKDTVLLNGKSIISKQQQYSQRQLNNETAIVHATSHEPVNGILISGNNNLHGDLASGYRKTINAGIDPIDGKNVKTIVAPILAYNTEQLVTAGKIASAGTNVPFNKTITEKKGTGKKKIDAIQTPSKIYWGIVFGPGINRVKNQKLQKPGFDIGIVAGVSILKAKAAVEAGLLYTQKYYFSDGKYFNMDKAGSSMPQGMDIMSLKGSSQLFELPVKFKYNVLQKNRSGVFMSTGISSYLMTREENDYVAMMNGSEQSMSGSYTNNCRYIAVMANIGAEYNYRTGKHTLIRIEPYIQIPLKGIGIGSMPVTTAGLHVGFMRFTP